MGIKFYADFKMELFIFESRFCQKLEPKNSIFRDFPKNTSYHEISFIVAFCHQGKFIFLKSTLNSVSIDARQDWVLTFFQPFLDALLKGIGEPR
jgi:hypothetical protein